MAIETHPGEFIPEDAIHSPGYLFLAGKTGETAVWKMVHRGDEGYEDRTIPPDGILPPGLGGIAVGLESDVVEFLQAR
jgi:hypothetical protein